MKNWAQHEFSSETLNSLYESGIGKKGLDRDSDGKHVRNSRESPDK